MIQTEKSLKDFVIGASAQLTNKVSTVLAPQYTPSEQTPFTLKTRHSFFQSQKTPYMAQQDAICALVKGYTTKRCMGLVAEMGCGKTLMGILTPIAQHIHTGHPIRTLIICPPHLVSTWTEELSDSLGNTVHIVDASGPNALSLLTQLRNAPRIPAKNEFWIMGFNRAKTSFSWTMRYFTQHKISEKSKYSEQLRYTANLCERCSKEEVKIDPFAPVKQRLLCSHCGNPLWGPDKKAAGSDKYSPTLYITKYLRKHFDFLVADEMHKLKGGDTIQGAMLGQLANVIPRTLVLTGTLSGGKASDVFYLPQRTFALNYSKEERRTMLPKYTELTSFVEQYGSIEEILSTKRGSDHKTGRSFKQTCNIKEKAGISPQLLKQFFLESCVFLRVSDISDALPDYNEVIEYCDLTDEMQAAYTTFQEELKLATSKAIAKRDMKVIGQVLSASLAWPDMPQNELLVTNRENDTVASAPALDHITQTPKDERLIECVHDAQQAGRKCLIFTEYTGKMQSNEYLQNVLAQAGFNFIVLSPTISSNKRLAWIRTKMESGKYDGMICQPKLVETGLNLREFPEVLFWETGYSTYVLRQASRRSWRPGQSQDVVVRFFINRNTMQETAMSLIAGKLEASLVLEGELSDKGLVALSDAGDSMAVELARALVGQLKTKGLEEQFKAYRKFDKSTMPSKIVVKRAQSVPEPLQVKRATISQMPPKAHTATKYGNIVGQITGVGNILSGKLFKQPVVAQQQGNIIKIYNKKGQPVGEFDGQNLTIEGTSYYMLVPIPALCGSSYEIRAIAS